MSNTLAPTAPNLPPRCVGIWLELETEELAAAQGEDRIRLARGLITGLDSIPEVESILVPCLPSAEGIMVRLFGDAMRPGRLMSAKLKLVPVGPNLVRREALVERLRCRRARALGRLAAIGATPSPWSWQASFNRLAESPRRPFGVTRRLLKLVRLSLGSWVTEARLAVLRCLPLPHAEVVACLRRRRVSATWFVLSGTSGWRLPGPKIVDGGGFVQPESVDRAKGNAALHRLVRAASGIVAPSRRAAATIGSLVGGRAVSVIAPAPLPASFAVADEGESRRRLAEDLRELFAGGAVTKLHRHFCDFPFERVEYLVAAPSRGATPILPAYAAVMRRHRRNLKLVVDGRLPSGRGHVADIHAMGLTFDVAEAAGLPEDARARLLRHARAVVVPDLDGPCLPPVFAEAVVAGTPVVLARSPAVREVMPDADLSSPEYFAVGSGAEESLVRAILHVLEHRDEVLARQRGLLARLASRTWQDVVQDYLRLVDSR